MAKQIITNAGLYLGGHELSGVANSVQIEGAADVFDATTFGALAREYLAGLKGVRLSAAGIYDPVAADAVLHGALGEADTLITCLAENTAGAVAFMIRGVEGEYSVGGSLQAPGSWQLAAQATAAPFIRGNCLHRAAAATASGSAAGQQLGAIASGKAGYATLHVFSVAGTESPSVTVKIQSDADGDFGTGATDRITFAAATAVGAQWASVAAPVSDTWWRATWTITGTSPSFGFVVSFGIL